MAHEKNGFTLICEHDSTDRLHLSSEVFDGNVYFEFAFAGGGDTVEDARANLDFVFVTADDLRALRAEIDRLLSEAE